MENIYNAIQNVYNMDKTTWQEVLAELYNLVSNVENKFDLFENNFGQLLGEEVTLELKKMYDDGSLAALINDKLLKEVNAKVDAFKTDVSEQLDTKANQSEIDTLSSRVNNIAGEKYKFFDQAFIKDCKLTCNNDHINSAGIVAKYIQTNMGSNVKKVMCRDYTTGGCIALISTKLNTKNYVNNITKGSIHIVFTTTQVDIGLFINNSLEVVKSIRYSSVLDTTGKTEYEFGYELLGNNTLKVYLPDGTTQQFTDNRLDDLKGQQVIYEHYMGNVEVTEEVTDNFAHPYFTGFYCTCESGIPLRDNFKRSNGSIGVAPSGHVYTLFRNTTEEDTVYDTSNGQIN